MRKFSPQILALSSHHEHFHEHGKEKCSIPGFFHQRFVNSSQSTRRSSSWLQNGCLRAMPVLRLGIHPEVERPATLNRSMPSTAGATMSNPAFRIPTVRQSLDEEHNLHIWEKVHLMESSFPRRFCISAHI